MHGSFHACLKEDFTMIRGKRMGYSLALCLMVLQLQSFGWSAYGSMRFPPARGLFATLMADPTDPHFSFGLGAPVSEAGIARIDVGDFLGLYRWKLPWENSAAQLSIGGAILTR